MGNPQTIGADTRLTLEPWFLTEVPPVDVDPRLACGELAGASRGATAG